ncbi:hypothetical protein FEE95_11220 [Maribacter algarum]|uniref:DUF4168 domain-containing protein n=1 Tax=Maribacter algarum (ex Zhang et al. 2020) TaxID=2578118 RepID=A0A5S3PQT4_9FLAO|nr:hypothetical protein [Maribacter algarum]TMM57054.1 hypothetical protein FEE95_11220 [Maribacter algarum]
MKLLGYFFLISLLATNFIIAQSSTETENAQPSSIFTQAESEYIDQWFTKFVKEMNLSEEVAIQYQEITSNYSDKMESIGKDNPDITKTEVIEQFKTLMQEQHQEIKPILSDEQYEMYYDTMKKVIWSINQRLK